MQTIGERLAQTTELFKKSGIDDAAFDAVVLIAAAEKITENDVRMHKDRLLNNEQTLAAYVERRLKREPVAKIVHSKGFWKYDFYVDESVLDPRPDTETLVESVLRRFPDRRLPYRILDLGTGSGCLVLSLLKEYENAAGVGMDFSQKALNVAVRNADSLAVRDRFSPVFADWCDDSFCSLFPEPFDIVVANPPYIAFHEKEILSPETLFDPETALFAEENGLKAYRDIAGVLGKLLKKDGEAFFECGFNQAPRVRDIFKNNALFVSGGDRDLAGNERCIRVKTQKKTPT